MFGHAERAIKVLQFGWSGDPRTSLMEDVRERTKSGRVVVVCVCVGGGGGAAGMRGAVRFRAAATYVPVLALRAFCSPGVGSCCQPLLLTSPPLDFTHSATAASYSCYHPLRDVIAATHDNAVRDL